MNDSVADAIVVILKGFGLILAVLFGIAVLAALTVAAGVLFHLGWNLT